MSWAPPGHWVSISLPMLSAPGYQPVNGGISQIASAVSMLTMRVDVLAPERVDVPLEQLLLGRRSRSVLDGLLGEVLLGHLGVGALERGVDRGGRGVERLGDLGGRPAEHVAQDQHGALAGRQVLQGGDEREPDRVALGDHRPRRPGPARATGSRGRPRGRRRRGESEVPRPVGSGRRAGPRGWSGRRWWRSGRARCGPRSGPRSRSYAFHARRKVSCTRSSASWTEPVIR